MFTAHNGHHAGQKVRTIKTLRLVAVLGTLLVTSIAVNALVILADSNLHP
jgi:hypothetical protein